MPQTYSILHTYDIASLLLKELNINERFSYLVTIKKMLSEDDLDKLAYIFNSMMVKNFDIDDVKSAREISENVPLSRTFEDQVHFLASAIVMYYSQKEIPHSDVLEDLNIHLESTEKKHFSPITISHDEIERVSLEMADIIDTYNRKTISFSEVLHMYRNSIGESEYKPPCAQNFMYLDTGSHCHQGGILTKQQMCNVIDTKSKCFHCPLQKGCLAASMTAKNTKRLSPKEVIIPTYENEVLTLESFLIFGGYTPQERKVIFYRTCEILRERDSHNI